MPDNQLSTANFQSLTAAIERVHAELSAQASKAVNVSLTVRNWLIGHYIAQYELHGQDRANYGDKLLEKLAVNLNGLGVPTCDKRRLYNYLRFYQTYPQIVRTAPAPLQKLLPRDTEAEPQQKVRTASAQFKLLENLSYSKLELLSAISRPTRILRTTVYRRKLVGSRIEATDWKLAVRTERAFHRQAKT